MLYDLQQRIFFVKTYYGSRSLIAVQRTFQKVTSTEFTLYLLIYKHHIIL